MNALPNLFRPGPALWGDRFADDEFIELLAVESWQALEADQLVRLYPALSRREGRPAQQVLDHLAAAVLARAHQCMAMGAAQPRRARRDGLNGGDKRAEHDFLNSVSTRAIAGEMSVCASEQTPLLAFLTGVHPAYLNLDALCSHERDTAAGWIGVLARGRPALMPIEVADYFADVVRLRDGVWSVVDPLLAPLVARVVAPQRLRAAALARQESGSVIVRPDAPDWLGWKWGGRPQPALALGANR